MIIRYPTALYKSVLPTEATSGNVTFLISSTDPPRAVAGATKLPMSVERRQRNISILTLTEEKRQHGQLAFTSFQSNPTTIGTAKLRFEPGQLLDFPADEVEDVELANVLANSETEMRHDTNLLDLTGLGVPASNVEYIESLASDNMSSLIAQTNVARQLRQDVEVAIVENKKQQVEAIKAIKALELLIASDTTLTNTYDILQTKLLSLQSQEQELTAQANEALSAVTISLDRMRAISQLVR